MELIIIGIVLFIVGVAATMFYDAHKAAKQKQAELRASRPPRPVPASPSRKKAQTLQDANEEFLARFKESMTQKPAPRKRPGPKVKGLKPEDFSINSDLTFEELIAKIQEMKKKL